MKERCRRDLIAGQYEIKTRHHQRGEGGPFFDGYAIGKARDQSEESPNDEKYQSGDNGHVIAGNRQHVADAGNEQGVIDICRDGVVPAVDQHRGNRAAIAGKNRANARVDGVAQPLNERVGALKWPFRARRRNHLDGAAYETRGADALEKQVSREVVATRFERLQRRLERPLQPAPSRPPDQGHHHGAGHGIGRVAAPTRARFSSLSFCATARPQRAKRR